MRTVGAGYLRRRQPLLSCGIDTLEELVSLVRFESEASIDDRDFAANFHGGEALALATESRRHLALQATLNPFDGLHSP